MQPASEFIEITNGGIETEVVVTATNNYVTRNDMIIFGLFVL
jgi:hypothetical protein